jgi:hypothetical protein
MGNPNEIASARERITRTHIRTKEIMTTPARRGNPAAVPESAYRKILSVQSFSNANREVKPA